MTNFVLKPAHHRHTATTSFFRNRAFLSALIEHIRSLPDKRTLRILFHSCSVGAEPYSFVMAARLAGLFDMFGMVDVHATDIAPEFIEIAKAGIYDARIARDMPAAARAFLEAMPGTETIRIANDIRQAVTFLPPASFTDIRTASPYDVVLCMNALTYVTPAQQHDAIVAMAGYTRQILCLTAYNPDIIKAAILAARFAPVRDHWLAIHYGWRERLRLRRAKPGSSRYDWVLPALPFFLRDLDYTTTAMFVPART